MKSIKFVAKHGFRHNDVKPQNFLVQRHSILGHDTRVYLSDFGFEGGKKGGTPLFASPECFLGTEVEYSDVFSLGGTFLYCLMTPSNFRWTLAIPVDHEDDPVMKRLNDAMALIPLMGLIQQMVEPNPMSRPRIDEVLQFLQNTNLDNLAQFKVDMNIALRKSYVMGCSQEFVIHMEAVE